MTQRRNRKLEADRAIRNTFAIQAHVLHVLTGRLPSTVANRRIVAGYMALCAEASQALRQGPE